MIYNANRGKNKPSKKPHEFHPFVKKPAARQATPDEIKALLGPNWHQVQT